MSRGAQSSSSAGLPRTWEEASRVYEERLLDYHQATGAEPDAPHVRSNVANNTVHIPARGDHLIRMLDELAGEHMQGRAVLDVGCGFGSLATYLAWRTRPRELVAVDVNEHLLAVATECAQQTGLDRLLTFAEADMRDLRPAGDPRFDVVIANGVIFYMRTRREFRAAVAEMYRMLVPGGTILFYQSNKWRPTDPFTRAPLVHLLPDPLALGAARVTGWKSSRDRVRLVSPPELSRALRRQGARNIRIVGFGKQHRHAKGPLRHFGQRFVLSAQHPLPG